MQIQLIQPGKPKNAGVGNLYFLQQIFLSQKLNQGVLHCRQILCQLSYLVYAQLIQHYVLIISQ